MNRYALLLMSVLFFYASICTGQGGINRPGSPHSLTQNQGGFGTDSTLTLPLSTVKFPAFDSNRRLAVLSNGNLALHDATKWNEQLPVKDSNRYVTPYQLTQQNLQTTTDNGNTTSNAITISGFDNMSSEDGLLLGNSSGQCNLWNVVSGNVPCGMSFARGDSSTNTIDNAGIVFKIKRTLSTINSPLLSTQLLLADSISNVLPDKDTSTVKASFPSFRIKGRTAFEGNALYYYDGLKFAHIVTDSSLNLQSVTTNGNTTTNDISVYDGAADSTSITPGQIINTIGYMVLGIDPISSNEFVYGNLFNNGGVGQLTLSSDLDNGATTFSILPSFLQWTDIVNTSNSLNVTFPISGLSGSHTVMLPNKDGTAVLNTDSNVIFVTPTQLNNAVLGGAYTPILSGGVNVTSSTAHPCTYSRTGNVVTVYGSLDLTTTLAIATSINISLPVSSNFSAVTDLNGFGNTTTLLLDNTIINADISNDVAALSGTALGVGSSGTVYFSFQYTCCLH